MPQRTTHFITEMQQLDALLAKLGGAAEDQLGQAIDAMQNRNAMLAEEVVAGDKVLDAMEADVERLVAQTFVRRQPMASDLRVTLSSIKIASAMERVGDLAKNTARRSLTLTASPPIKLLGSIVRFGGETLDLFGAALEAYIQRDLESAKKVWVQDEQLDHTHNSLLREIIAEMENDPSRIPLYTQMMFISKNMERIGDHSTFIAEMTHYIVTGYPPADDRPKGPPDGLLKAGV